MQTVPAHLARRILEPLHGAGVRAGIIEVKDILESSAIEELKNMAHGLDGNYVVIKETNYKTTFVIHKAEAFKCN